MSGRSKNKFVDNIISSVIEIFKIQCDFDLVSSTIQSKASKSALKPIIGSIINLNCEEFSGSVGIFFPEDTFLTISRKMLGEEITQIDDSLKDNANEFLNMIYGRAKRIMNDDFGASFPKALPETLHGQSLTQFQLLPNRKVINRSQFVSEDIIDGFYIEFAK